MKASVCYFLFAVLLTPRLFLILKEELEIRCLNSEDLPGSAHTSKRHNQNSANPDDSINDSHLQLQTQETFILHIAPSTIHPPSLLLMLVQYVQHTKTLR